jgi:GTP-binding protein YchF
VERFGLVGLPNAGKSSLLNALSAAGALAAPYPFATTETNLGVARVPDRRLDEVARVVGSPKVVHATVEFFDIGGLVEGASRGEGLGNRFLAGIREVDAIVMVLRAFEDPDVVGPSDPVEHLAVLETELALADLQRVEEHIDKRRKAARIDRSLAGEVAALEAALVPLAGGTPIYRSGLDPAVRAALQPWFLLTDKPVLAVVNVGEDQLADVDRLVKPIADAFAGDAEVLPVCVQLEAEAAELPEDERVDLLVGLGLGEGALTRLVRNAHATLDRRTFFTANENEAHAWTFRRGATARECAGLVHTDFERGFIRAEVVHWDHLVELGSWHAAREAGHLRIEGREYEVRDGDVLEVRFNV